MQTANEGIGGLSVVWAGFEPACSEGWSCAEPMMQKEELKQTFIDIRTVES